jgi:hypothetical protein
VKSFHLFPLASTCFHLPFCFPRQSPVKSVNKRTSFQAPQGPPRATALVTGHALVTRSRFYLVSVRPDFSLCFVTCYGVTLSAVVSRVVSRVKSAQSLGKHGLVTVSRVKTPPRQTNSPAITNVKCSILNFQSGLRRSVSVFIRVHPWLKF